MGALCRILGLFQLSTVYSCTYISTCLNPNLFVLLHAHTAVLGLAFHLFTQLIISKQFRHYYYKACCCSLTGFCSAFRLWLAVVCQDQPLLLHSGRQCWGPSAAMPSPCKTRSSCGWCGAQWSARLLTPSHR